MTETQITGECHMNGSHAIQRQHCTASATGIDRRPRESRRQCLSALEVVTLVAIAGLLIAGAVAVQPHAATGTVTQTVQVQAGETLWSIAQAHPIAGLTTSQAAESISHTNRLATSTLRTGQTLQVPVAAQRTAQMASR